MQPNKDKIQSPAAETALRDYFQSDGTRAGLRAAALERPDGGGATSPDARMTDERIEKLTAHRRTRAALVAIGNARASALWLAYGPQDPGDRIEIWSPAPAAPTKRKGSVEARKRAREERRELRATGLEVRGPGGWVRLEGCKRDRERERLRDIFGRDLGIALRSRALAAALAGWLRTERAKFAEATGSVFVATENAESMRREFLRMPGGEKAAQLAEQVVVALGLRAVLRARVEAGSWVERHEASPVALADSDQTYRMLARLVRDSGWVTQLEAVRAEAEATRLDALAAFATAAGHVIHRFVDRPPRAPRPSVAPALRRIRKAPPALLETSA